VSESLIFVITSLKLSPANEVLDNSLTPALTSLDKSHRESTVVTENNVSESVIYTPAPSQTSSRTSSMLLQHEVEEQPIRVIHLSGYESPLPVDERIAQIKNERRYRLLLTHDYHPSRMSFRYCIILYHPDPDPKFHCHFGLRLQSPSVLWGTCRNQKGHSLPCSLPTARTRHRTPSLVNSLPSRVTGTLVAPNTVRIEGLLLKRPWILSTGVASPLATFREFRRFFLCGIDA
jgi:hypothetical protein